MLGIPGYVIVGESNEANVAKLYIYRTADIDYRLTDIRPPSCFQTSPLLPTNGWRSCARLPGALPTRHVTFIDSSLSSVSGLYGMSNGVRAGTLSNRVEEKKISSGPLGSLNLYNYQIPAPGPRVLQTLKDLTGHTGTLLSP
jgi:hypothetical protein